jgi:phage terminase large subunit
MPAPEALLAWRHDPVRFVRDTFNVERIEPWQEQALRAFGSSDPADQRIGCQAPVGVGKDAYMSWCGWNFIGCYGGLTNHPQGVCLGPTDEQLHDTLWKEYARWYNEPSAEWLRREFSMTHSRIASRRFPDTWFISARAFPKDADAETQGRTLSGLHAPFVLIQFAEAATIPSTLCRTAEQARSGKTRWWKFQMAFNPIVRDGAGGVAAFDERDRWRLFEITGDPDDPDRCSLIPIEMAREEIRLKGRDDPWVMAHILGKFPPGGLNTLFAPDEVSDAMKRHVREDDYAWAAKIISADIGRQGLDPSVVGRRQGRVFFPFWKRHGIDGIEGAGYVARQWQDWHADACFIDDTGGFGGSWIDQLRVLGFTPVGVQFAGAPRDKRFLNKRAEMAFAFRDWVREGGALPPDKNLAKQMVNLRYAHKGDKLKLEEKDEYRKRYGTSTDEFDTCILSFAHPVQPSHGALASALPFMGLDGPQLAVTEEVPPWARD